MSLAVAPSTIRAARAFVSEHHRHHPAPQGGLFALSVRRDGETVGVAIIGRPVARLLDDGTTAEVTRLATIREDIDGEKKGPRNACSLMYAAAWRAARALGYRRLVTYVLESEPGTSLKAAGWRRTADVRARSWNRSKRARTDKHPTGPKVRWEIAVQEKS